MTHRPLLTPSILADLCQHVFPERDGQRGEAIEPLRSRQHEMVAFDLIWRSEQGIQRESLIARRYVSTVSWWRADDLGKAQREITIMRWLREEGFPVPTAYGREFSALGDLAVFSRAPGADWSASGLPFHDAIRAYAGPLAELLARLHELPPTKDVQVVTPTVTLPIAIANLNALAIRLEHQGIVEMCAKAMRWAFEVPETPPVLLHGDYHFSNALLHKGQIAGIIDWEYAALGDPRWDISNAYMQLVDFDAADAANDFLQTYLAASGRSFDGPPVHNLVSSIQQWAISEWLARQQQSGEAAAFSLADDLIALRDVHRRRAETALRALEE